MMSVFDHIEFDRHEEVVFFHRPECGLKAIVAIHNTHRGPALGGVRMYPYRSDADALQDVLRLSKGMTYKSAISALPLGGGKSVIIGDPRSDKSAELFEAFGACLDTLAGRYIAAEDSGTTVQDLEIIASKTAHISGVGERETEDGAIVDGDPSPATAYGVFMGIQAAVKHRLQCESLSGIKVAVQGAGAVGSRLVQHLTQAGAEITVADIYSERAVAVAEQFNAKVVDCEQVYDEVTDVFSPCALGAVLNEKSIPRIKAKIVAGAANNQLASMADMDMLAQHGVLYVPDFAINAGGVIDIASFRAGLTYEQGMQQVAGIYQTVTRILECADREGATTLAVAQQLAEADLRS